MWLIVLSPHNLHLQFCCVLFILALIWLILIIIIIIVIIINVVIIVTNWDFFTLALDDGLSLEFERQQVSSSLQDSSQYSGQSQ